MHRGLKRHFLKESETKQVLARFHSAFNLELPQIVGSKPRVEVVETEKAKVYVFNQTPSLVETGGNLFPTLLFKEMLVLIPKIVVDTGAIPHICNGADIMAPGIVKTEGRFSKDSLLLIVEGRYGKPIAIGQALLDSESFRATKQGKVIKNIHYVGDEIWNLTKELS